MINDAGYSLARDIESRQWHQLYMNKWMDSRINKLRMKNLYDINLRQNPSITAIDIDDTDTLMVCGGSNGSVRVLKIDKLLARKNGNNTLKPSTSKYDENGMINDVQFCRIDNRLFIISTNQKLTLCETSKKRRLGSKTFQGNHVQFHWNEYNSTNPMLAVSDRTNRAHLIDFRVGFDLAQEIRCKDETVTSVQWYSSNRHLLYTGDISGHIYLFDIRSARQALQEKNVSNCEITSIRTNRDGFGLYVLDCSNCLRKLDTFNLSRLSKKKLEHKPNNYCPRIIDEYGQTFYVYSSPFGITVLKYPQDCKDEVKIVDFKSPIDCMNSLIFRKSSLQMFTGGSYSTLVMWDESEIPEEVKEFQDEWSDTD